MLKRHTKDTGDNMAITIERIITAQSCKRNDFIKKQNKRLAQLRKIEERKNAGCRIQQRRIIAKLQNAGILDENGEVSAPYRDENE